MEINKAEVDVEGDIDILGGIIGSKVKTNGNIKTRYIEASTIRALGISVSGMRCCMAILRPTAFCR